jgi:hypothetical protein
MAPSAWRSCQATPQPISGTPRSAAIAQLVEHVIRNDGVGGSNPSCGTSKIKDLIRVWGCLTRPGVTPRVMSLIDIEGPADRLLARGKGRLLNDQPDLQADLLLASKLVTRWLRDGTDLGTPFSLPDVQSRSARPTGPQQVGQSRSPRSRRSPSPGQRRANKWSSTSSSVM